MELKDMLYEGKAKQVFLTENPNRVVVRYKDTATAFNNIKKATIVGKGKVTSAISALLYEYLAKAGIKTHFVELVDECDQLCRRVQVIPLEVVVRNTIAGSMAQRLGVEEGVEPQNVIYDLYYKRDDLDDPLMNDHHAVALELVSYEELKVIYGLAEQINTLLLELFRRAGIRLVDFKMEFGRTPEGEIILADELSPDTCRLWDIETGEKLDKDRFRRDLGRVREAYELILTRLQAVKN
ncbi:MAG: phosphoribosylaminoimidazolesuccinocarboxamide synthase [Rikenellaceae bacterium]|nr:phosphoribosylaminoimidazolesuccinocarboxamide synthase [Rikenellaceae bacterium]